MSKRASLPFIRQNTPTPGNLRPVPSEGKSTVPSMPHVVLPDHMWKGTVVYIASYGHRTAILRLLQKAGWLVPLDRVLTPGSFPGHIDGRDMRDGKAAMLQYVAGLHPGMPLVLVDDCRENVACARSGGWKAVRVRGKRGLDIRCMEKIAHYCSRTPSVLVLDFDLTLCNRHITGELCRPYLHLKGSFEGIEDLLQVEMLVDDTFLRMLFPPSWSSDFNATSRSSRSSASSTSSAVRRSVGSRGIARDRSRQPRVIR
eukprot:EG_transcript_14880